jgi:selenocysteine lyase/cysteine desulfurase
MSFPKWLSDVRSRIPLLSRYNAYLDNAGAGPLTVDVYNAMRGFLDSYVNDGEPWDDVLLKVYENRRLFAELIGADADEVAVIPNVSTGLAVVAVSIPFRGRIVTSPLNFPTDIYPWLTLRSRGLISEVVFVNPRGGYVPLEEYEEKIDDNTVAVVVDYVSWITGYRENIREIARIAHEHGAIIICDAFQALGVVDVNVKREDIDVLVSGLYKWLMGPHGIAYLYVSRKALEVLKPAVSSWHGVRNNVVKRRIDGWSNVFSSPFSVFDVELSDDASRFELGTWSEISLYGGKAALEFALRYEMPRKYVYTEKLIDRLMDGLVDLNYEVVTPHSSKAGIVVFKAEKNDLIRSYLSKRGIEVSSRPGVIRVSPHFYNTMHEIELFLDVMGEVGSRLYCR